MDVLTVIEKIDNDNRQIRKFKLKKDRLHTWNIRQNIPVRKNFNRESNKMDFYKKGVIRQDEFTYFCQTQRLKRRL